jgi:phthalate 4,5-dioxygenase reductase subunit
MNAPSVLTVRVTRKTVEAEDICSFELASVDGAALPSFSAGSHVDVQVPGGLTRQYSLCNDPAESHRYLIGVLRDAASRGGSIAMHEHVHEGSLLQISPPKNHFALAHQAVRHLLLAGGIGITPIMAMMRELKNVGGRFRLYYCTRAPALTAFRDELLSPEFSGQVTLHHDDGDPARALDLWPILERPKGMHLYCCGPTPMMQAVRDMTGHWSASTVHFEAFSEPERVKPDDKPFLVRLAQSGDTVEVPVGTTILEALRAHGLIVPSSCESGTCGSCRTRLLAGEADHRDLVLAGSERADNIMVCVSRARSDEITIDR